MDCNLYCLVDEGGHVYVKDGAASYSDVAASFGLDAHACDTYRFIWRPDACWSIAGGRPTLPPK